jgi:hypothetical protein
MFMLPRLPAAGHRPHMEPKPQPSLRVPVEIIGVIGECLAGSYSYGTLSKLSLTCKLVRAEVLPVLFGTLVWDNEHHSKQREWWNEVLEERSGRVYQFPEGWKYASRSRSPVGGRVFVKLTPFLDDGRIHIHGETSI